MSCVAYSLHLELLQFGSGPAKTNLFLLPNQQCQSIKGKMKLWLYYCAGDVYHCSYPDCSYSTPKRSQLACHTRAVHLQVRSHVCSECGRAFVERSHLVRHMRTHLAVKPFTCPRCSYTSSRRDKLKDHCARHHPETDGNDVEDLASPSRKSRRRAKKPAVNNQMTSGGDAAAAEADAVTEAVVNLVVSVPVIVSGRELVADDDNLVSSGPVDGNVVPTLSGMEVCVLDNVGVPSLSAGTYKLLVGQAGGAVFLPSEKDAVNLTSSGIKCGGSSSSTVELPVPSSCSSLLLLGEVADGQLPATTVV